MCASLAARRGPQSHRARLIQVETAERLWFLDDEPSARFPVYSRGNVGEVVPHVATPLMASLTADGFRRGFGSLFSRTGAFRRQELDDPSGTGGIFGGYLYLNLSFARVFARRLPGLKVADVDEQLTGSSAAPPYEPQPDDRSIPLTVRATLLIAPAIVRRRRPDLETGRAEVLRWLAALPVQPSDSEALEVLRGFSDRFVGELEVLLDSSIGAGMPLSMLDRLGGKGIREEPGLVVKAISGLGTIETARMAVDMWDLGREVAGSDELTAAFDAGVTGLFERLGATDSPSPEVAAFLEQFEVLLHDHGHRGPNEVEPAAETWGTSPEIALAAIDKLRAAGSDADPHAAAERLARERVDASAAIRRKMPPGTRWLADRLVASAARGAARRETAKATIVHHIAGLRQILFAVADRMVTRGQLPDRFSLFMVTVDELPAFLADPESFAERVEERRRRYHELNALTPPSAFSGRMPDPSTWTTKAALTPRVAVGAELTGIGVSSGRAQGRVRIVTDPAEPLGLSPEEILVAPLTDPAWTPLFLAASAVVVDVGAVLSHAAIVARELGIPAVVSVEGASAILRDGDEVEVDGDRGVVRVTALAPL